MNRGGRCRLCGSGVDIRPALIEWREPVDVMSIDLHGDVRTHQERWTHGYRCTDYRACRGRVELAGVEWLAVSR